MTVRPAPGWFWVAQPRPQARLRLLCFPYAGGRAALFRRWPAGLPASVEVWAVQLPGRVPRLREPALRDASELVERVVAAAHAHPGPPWALFGHSMGALLAYEAARQLERSGERPRHLFVSGQRAPHLPSGTAWLHPLDDREFLRRLDALGGTPPEILAHGELMSLLLPALRADVELVERYGLAGDGVLDTPITAFGGDRDQEVPPQDVAAWGRHTRAPFACALFPGDHFFVHGAEAEVLAHLHDTLEAALG